MLMAFLASLVIAWMLSDSYTAVVEQVTIDGFEYGSDEQAQEAWRAMEGASPVRLSGEGVIGRALLLPCDFAQPVERRYWDKPVKLDLSRCDAFSISVNPSLPDAIGRFTVYFR